MLLSVGDGEHDEKNISARHSNCAFLVQTWADVQRSGQIVQGKTKRQKSPVPKGVKRELLKIHF